MMANLSRRDLLALASAAAAGGLLRPLAAAAETQPPTRPIPSSRPALPPVGLGSWITFNVGNDRVARDSCAEVMRAFFAAGGRMIDSSPMYGSSQEVIGYGLKKLGMPEALFATDKVWIGSGARGRAQIEASRRFWGVARLGPLQGHNPLAPPEHLPTPNRTEQAGPLRSTRI